MKRNTANALYNGFFVGVASFGGGIFGALLLEKPVLGFFITVAFSFISSAAIGFRYGDRKAKP